MNLSKTISLQLFKLIANLLLIYIYYVLIYSKGTKNLKLFTSGRALIVP